MIEDLGGSCVFGTWVGLISHPIFLLNKFGSLTLITYLCLTLNNLTIMDNIKINTTIFEIDVLVNFTSHSTLWSMAIILKKVKKSLEDSKKFLIEHTFNFDENVEMVSSITTQLEIVDKNIDSVSIALLVKEGDIFEHVIEMEVLDLHIIGLN